ncbi:glycosyltransferase family 2 protein [Patescibacteria group bacterium]|nr:glycosyltransferase family 2 protein [Patescibacteria group bacterium]
MARFSIVITSWNGLSLLKKNLAQVLAAVDKDTELIVVDNGSTDGSVEWIEKNFSKSEVRVVSLSRNFGFGPACNLGVDQTSSELVVLLNNDVIPERGFLDSVEESFAEKQVFAVSFHEPGSSWATGKFEKGFFTHSPGPKTKQKHLSLWASGGSAAFRRSYWRELNGFDPLFHPFYWEDTDLGFRAWKRGWTIWWEPRSVVHHRHESTISRLPVRFVTRIKERNELIFLWKNILELRSLGEHLAYLLKRVFSHPGYGLVVFLALLKLPQLVVRRYREEKRAVITSSQVLAKFKDE